ncbi:hypothetical protein CPC08DRAFT_532416 [Agrocybe pediades]|nr:hypothetical protein CPC08DRAFT_532416 [Agrocybe pediades]
MLHHIPQHRPPLQQRNSSIKSHLLDRPDDILLFLRYLRGQSALQTVYTDKHVLLAEFAFFGRRRSGRDIFHIFHLHLRFLHLHLNFHHLLFHRFRQTNRPMTTMHFQSALLQLQYPLLALHQIKELLQERFATQRLPRAKNDKLAPCPRERHIDPPPVFEQIADLKKTSYI